MPDTFSGTWPYWMDGKGRLTIPMEFAPGLGEFPVLTRGPEPCLYLLPVAAWNELQERHGRSVLFHQVYGTWKRGTRLAPAGGHSVNCRVQIPQALREVAGLEPGCRVAVVGAGRGVILCEWERWKGIGGYPARNLSDLFGTLAPPVSELLDLSLLGLYLAPQKEGA